MKNFWCILVLIVGLLANMSVFGEEPEITVSFNPDTGDAEFDVMLGNINITAEANLPEFITNLSVRYNVSEEELEPLITEEEMTPADTFLAVALADFTDKALEEVVEEYKTNKDKGWGFIAKQLGIKPGSKEFHALKNGGLEELEAMKAQKGGDEEESKKKEKKEKKDKKK
jgi:hypothetical protein